MWMVGQGWKSVGLEMSMVPSSLVYSGALRSDVGSVDRFLLLRHLHAKNKTARKRQKERGKDVGKCHEKSIKPD